MFAFFKSAKECVFSIDGGECGISEAQRSAEDVRRDVHRVDRVMQLVESFSNSFTVEPLWNVRQFECVLKSAMKKLELTIANSIFTLTALSLSSSRTSGFFPLLAIAIFVVCSHDL